MYIIQQNIKIVSTVNLTAAETYIAMLRIGPRRDLEQMSSYGESVPINVAKSKLLVLGITSNWFKTMLYKSISLHDFTHITEILNLTVLWISEWEIIDQRPVMVKPIEDSRSQ